MFKNLTLLNLIYEETSNIQTFTYFKEKVNVDQIKKYWWVYFVPIRNPVWQPPQNIGSICKTKSNVTSETEDGSLVYVRSCRDSLYNWEYKMCFVSFGTQ